MSAAMTDERKRKKAEAMRKWRKRNAARLRRYEAEHRVRRNALRRARDRRNPKTRMRCAAWRARNPEWMRNHYRENLSHFTGNGKWSTRAVRARRAYREWTKTLSANRVVSRAANRVNKFTPAHGIRGIRNAIDTDQRTPCTQPTQGRPT